MKKKKVLKIVLIVLLSLILAFILAVAAIFQFMIKPHSEELTTAVEQLITELENSEFIEENIEVDEGLISEDLSEYIIDDIIENNPTNNTETQQPKKPQKEYESTYDYIKDNVETSDFKKGVSFASRIDIAYILGLLKDGLTVPEKRELKAYLLERFTQKEVSEGISLYNKYSYLLK